MILFLLINKKKLNPNTKTNKKMSDLEFCRLAHDGKLDALKEKISSSARVEDITKKKDSTGRQALHWACVGGRKDIVEYLINEYNVPLNVADESGWTPLIISSSIGNNDLVKLLLERGCDPNAVTENGTTALHYACSKNHVETARLLLQHKADTSICDNYGQSPLHRAASKGNSKIVDLLLSEYKAAPNLTDVCGNSPLHMACEEERIDTCKLLLKYKADPYLKNKEGKTPVDFSFDGLLNLIEMNKQEMMA